MSAPLNGAIAIAYAMMTSAADKGDVAPSNNDIANELGSGHASYVSELVVRLEARGFIRVERGTSWRRITIVATGQTICSRLDRPPQQNVVDQGYRGPVPEHLRVNREPCGFCGVRADVGCHHQRMAA
jgi:hypothetical protein